jgi:ribosome-associated translation inhibitor RaiA
MPWPITRSKDAVTNLAHSQVRRQGEKRGPYSSLASVTLMIARQLKRETKKREDQHKLPD